MISQKRGAIISCPQTGFFFLFINVYPSFWLLGHINEKLGCPVTLSKDDIERNKGLERSIERMQRQGLTQSKGIEDYEELDE